MGFGHELWREELLEKIKESDGPVSQAELRKEVGMDVEYTDTAEYSKTEEEQKPNGGTLKGWICPVCGRRLSPYTSVCPCKGFNPGWKVTC